MRRVALDINYFGGYQKVYYTEKSVNIREGFIQPGSERLTLRGIFSLKLTIPSDDIILSDNFTNDSILNLNIQWIYE